MTRNVFLLTPFIAIYIFEVYMVSAFVLGFHRSEEYIRLLPNNVACLLLCILITLLFVLKKIKSLKSSKSELNKL